LSEPGDAEDILRIRMGLRPIDPTVLDRLREQERKEAEEETRRQELEELEVRTQREIDEAREIARESVLNEVRNRSRIFGGPEPTVEDELRAKMKLPSREVKESY
jgi:hypothetical protein